MNMWTEDSVGFEKAKGSLSNAGWSKCEVVFSKQKTQQTIGLLKAVTPANLEGTFTKLSFDFKRSLALAVSLKL